MIGRMMSKRRLMRLIDIGGLSWALAGGFSGSIDGHKQQHSGYEHGFDGSVYHRAFAGEGLYLFHVCSIGGLQGIKSRVG